MKYDCDRGRRRRDAKRAARFKWHRWFAWYPIKIGPGDCRWLETIECRRYYISHYYSSYFGWDYRSLR